MGFRPLPVGVDDFQDIIENGYYYVDKTEFIRELWEKKEKVNLFTRPGCFGKTLNMSMLKYFFEDTGDKAENREKQKLFAGLKVMDAEDVVSQMGKYPVISLSLKSSKQPDWELSCGCLKEEISREYLRHIEILESLQTEGQRRRFEDIMNLRASQADFVTALRFLSDCLCQVYGEKVIILIDEYDVPLENAYYCGFYNKMSDFIRSLFESALKTNPNLEFAVVTGCLRISKESIFTGLNNLNVISILSSQYGEYFGFLQEEVDVMLEAYGLMGRRDTVKQWYNGYLFGTYNVYNPWSVINYVLETISGGVFPRPYWSNTSSNSIVKDLINRADMAVKKELDALIAGEAIEKPVHEDITYDSIYDSQNNLWIFLFFTGYLKMESVRMEEQTWYISLSIPNAEVRYIYNTTIQNWFQDKIKVFDLDGMYQALLQGNEVEFQKELAVLLQQSISYMDSGEAFYHGFLLGVLGNMKDYLVRSNREGGNGRLDLSICSPDVSKTPVIIELKVSPSFKGMEAACDKALTQIEEKGYDSWLPEEEYTKVWHYGIAFFKKQCRVKVRLKKFVT